MSSIFPIREKVSLDRDPEPRLVDLDEDTADEVFEALASSTTREIFLELHNQPQTASDLADVTDTSVQNVQYHLEKLEDVDLVEVVDTWYSERGSEMKVYAPEDESLVLFAGRDKQGAFRRLLNRFAGVFALLVPPSILAGWLANRGGSEEQIRGEWAGADADGSGGAVRTTTEEGEDVAAGTDGGDGDSGGIGTQDVSGTDTPAATETPQPEGTLTPEGTPAPHATQTPEQSIPQATDGGVPETPADIDNQSVEIVVDNATDLAEVTTTQNDTVYLAVDSASSSDIMGIDPTVALAFFLGGLAVYGALVLRRRVI
ncbi:DNA-binding transcriptional regulator, ArsR family [Halovenus aranensis]|jgi:DNA-binding transcriptional ArsR family regulator|uniref:DNA-binding transcriptional regulator, ArsR family n=1 Tax=Halovenus aranensis TaxID=890420 RepID=A0A1G8YW62_9EURY|nr:helix-turn-helix domain-containing protein [Halovenus aranensis]SDK06230.1 DNA-binding transcriptional regulator, ArsR family [Halovenus aranensis]